MVESFSVRGSRMGASTFGREQKPKKLVNCKGQGGNPSSLATKKAPPNKKPPKTDIFAAQA